MKMLPAFVILAGLAGTALAESSPLATAVGALGRINGQALACGDKAVAARAKTLMIEKAPKTRDFGEIYENATSEAFRQAGTGGGCPDEGVLASRLEAAARLLAQMAAHRPSGAEEPPQAGIVPRYLLRDYNGRAVSDGDFRGRFQLISFGYTYCPDICPTTLIEMAEILKQLGDQAERLQALFVSVDPERDTLEVLKSYTGFFDARILGLTASPELVRRAADNFKVRYEKVREPGAAPNQYSVDHSAGMYLLAPSGEFIVKFAYATPVTDVVARIREFMALGPRSPAPPR